MELQLGAAVVSSLGREREGHSSVLSPKLGRSMSLLLSYWVAPNGKLGGWRHQHVRAYCLLEID